MASNFNEEWPYLHSALTAAFIGVSPIPQNLPVHENSLLTLIIAQKGVLSLHYEQ